MSRAKKNKMPGDQGDCPFDDPLEMRVYDYILSNRLLHSGCHVIAGISGGADSVCLLFLLCGMMSLLDLQVTAVHVHHGIRGCSADRDARATEELCRSLGIPCLVFRKNVPAYAKLHGLSEEEAGRKIRYGILRRVKEEKCADVIGVAHHADDSAETVLWNLIRGTGLAGLAGIAPKRNDIIRPLLCCTRKEITAYLEKKGVSWCEDETNDLTVYTRNKIRRTIIPAFREINPKASEHILWAAEIIGETHQWLEQEARKLIGRHAVSEEGQTALPVDILRELPRALRMQVCLSALAEVKRTGEEAADRDGGALNNISRRHLLLIEELLNEAHNSEVRLPGNLSVRRRYDSLVFERVDRREKRHPYQAVHGSAEHRLFSVETFPGEWEIPRGFQPWGTLDAQLLSRKNGEKIPEKVYTKWFDYDKIKDTLSVRTRQPGDYIRIMPGDRKKTVKAFMIDEKIPREYRDKILLVADGSHVLWIVGHRISEGCKVSEHTKTILQIRMRKEREDE